MNVANTTHLDRSFFSVMVDHSRDIGVSLVERDIDDNRAEIIFDIKGGEYHRVLAVMEFNPIEGWASNISDEIAQAVIEAHDDYAEWGDCAREFVCLHKPDMRAWLDAVHAMQNAA